MALENVYQYRIKQPERQALRLNRIKPAGRVSDPEPLSGIVQNMPATDIEERVARALYKLQVPFRFQVTVPVLGSLPGKGKVIDFLLYTRIPQPLEVDGIR